MTSPKLFALQPGRHTLAPRLPLWLTMTTFDAAAIFVWKVVLIVLLAITLLTIVAANRPIEPASWSRPPHMASPFAGPVLRTV